MKLYKSYQHSIKEKILPFEDFNSPAKSQKTFSSKFIGTSNQIPLTQDPSPFLLSPMINGSVKDSEIDSSWKETPKLKDQKDIYKESRVGKKLSDLTMKRVIILVLVLIFIVPLFSSSYYNDTDLDYTIQLKIMAEMSNTQNPDLASITQIYNDYINYNPNRNNPIVYCQIPSISKFFQTMDPSELRNQEKQELSYALSQYNNPFTTTVSVRKTEIYSSMMNILRTLFVCIVLAFGAYFFSKDVNNLALKPIERMIVKVNKIASNPLASKDQTLIAGSDKMQYETSL